MTGSSVLVTGSSSGIGRATALRFLEAGWHVYATARDPADLADLADRGCHTLALDVTDDDLHHVLDYILDDVSDTGLDCLVNNAGFGQYGPLEDVPTERLERQFDVNLYGPHRLCRVTLPALRAAGGTIVSVSSLAAHAPFPGAGAYCASKAALGAHHDALRVELGGSDVDVVLVEPGPVETGFRTRRERELAALSQSDAYAAVYDRHRGETTRGGLFGAVTPDDVADAIFGAATRPNPPARLPVGWRVRAAIALARFTPDSWRERVYDWL